MARQRSKWRTRGNLLLQLILSAVVWLNESGGLPLLLRASRLLDESVACRGREMSVRILVADDNVDAADSLALLLELRGHEVRAAFNGGDAVRLAQEWHPDAAILDLNMPVLDGQAVAARLRSDFPCVVLVALSGHIGVGHASPKALMFDLRLAKGSSTSETLEQLVHLVSAKQTH